MTQRALWLFNGWRFCSLSRTRALLISNLRNYRVVIKRQKEGLTLNRNHLFHGLTERIIQLSEFAGTPEQLVTNPRMNSGLVEGSI